MTLFIAWILLYHFQMDWWWYIAAIVAYVGHIYFQIYIAIHKKSPHDRFVTWWTQNR